MQGHLLNRMGDEMGAPENDLARYESEQDREYSHDLAIDHRASEILSDLAEFEQMLTRMIELHPGFLNSWLHACLPSIPNHLRASFWKYAQKTAELMAEDEEDEYAAGYTPETQEF